jgi:O-antigen/teichoic acid export membrane protein
VAFFKALGVLLGSGFMIAIGRDRKYITLIWISLSVNILFNLYMIPRLGAVGAAAASVVAEGLLVVTLIVANREFLSKDMLKMISVYTVSAIPVVLMINYFPIALKANFTSVSIMFGLIVFSYTACLCGIFRQYYIFKLTMSILTRVIRR